MSGSDGPKAKAISSWQRPEDAKSTRQVDHQPMPDLNEQAESEDRVSLVEKAAKFLEDEDIRDAPKARKEYFLTLKGLTEGEIRDLLKEQDVQEKGVAKESENKGQEASQSSIPSESSASTEQTPNVPSKDIPPIITYPEFLLHSQKPPPLITLQRLLNTFYLTTGAAATLYGASKYVVEPMVESLNSARHSLNETAAADLDKLNEKLENIVSKAPEVSHSVVDDSDAESTSSNPARFFNRSTATQTSPSLSRSTSDLSDPSEATPSAVATHQLRLSMLHNKLSDLLPEKSEAENSIRSNMDELRRYLDGLTYASVSSSGRKAGEMDEIAKVKAEIRGVKGVLLSARNFPSSVALPVR